MTRVAEQSEARLPFEASEITPEVLIVSYVIHRFAKLSKESLSALMDLVPELRDCDSAETYREIADTMREILFPNEMIGNLQKQESRPPLTERLQKRSEWIGKIIKALREEKDWTQDKLAEESELPQSHISRLEKGKHSPSRRTLERIAKALGVDLRELDPAEE